MIGYVTLGTNDIEKAAAFYDALLAEFGAERFMESEQFIAWSSAADQPAVSVSKPFDGNPATVGNGVMVALMVDSTDILMRFVDDTHAAASQLTNEAEVAEAPEVRGLVRHDTHEALETVDDFVPDARVLS